MTRSRGISLAAAGLVCAVATLTSACTRPAAQQEPAPASGTFAGESTSYEVRGSYEPIVIEQVDRLARENGDVVVRGPTTSVPVELPALVDRSQPNPAWRLVTETAQGNMRRVTFTHDTSLEEVSFALPASQAELHYGAFLSKEGGSVLVFAWGRDWHCYWGYAILTPKPS